MPPKALPPGPGLSTRNVQALVRVKVRRYGEQVLEVLRPVFRDLDPAGKDPTTHAEKFAAGGAIDLPDPVGSPMTPTDLAAWLDRAEYPLLRATPDGYQITSGADVLARALGAGARSVEVMLRDRGEVLRLTLRLTAGITQAQLTSVLFDLPDVPKFDLSREFRGLSRQSIRSANAQVQHLDVGRPFAETPESVRRFQLAARRASTSAEKRARQLRAEMIGYLRARAHTGPVRYDGQDFREDGILDWFRDLIGKRSGQAARESDQEAHEADVETAQARSEKLGISRYKWISSRDERTRKRHLDMDGNVYSWDDPPEADPGQYYHPGKRNNCRCTASALEEDILAALDGE
jgi:SPP1 gp7 family putative phage head morphogenesis protein